MKCPRCQTQNPADAVYCEECGARLETPCPSCGESNRLGAKFCKKCGQELAQLGLPGSTAALKFGSPAAYVPKHLAEKILTSRSALEGERKQVTVLFADLKGSMELLADRDPEEARRLLDPVLDHMLEAVHRYEGTVNQVMGDGIMALFGAPLAHEDHAVRACYAALRLQESLRRYAEGVRRQEGLLIQVRVGLNSGEVVVRSIGSDLHMDYTAVGQTTHLAARMEQLAAPGSILLTAETLRLAEGYIQVKSLGPMTVKGVTAPVEAYELTGIGTARSRFQAMLTRGLSRFVGRDPEIEQLRRVLEHAHQGHGQVVGIVGEPGVGKSRLVFEVIHSHRVEGWVVLESSSVSYGKATSYLPVIDLLKGYFKLGDRDSHRDILEKVTGKLLTLDRSLEPTLPALLSLLDVPVEDTSWQALDPPQRRQRTLDAVKRLLLREAQVQPILVVFEDLHWIDSESQAFLDGLIESLPTARLLLLVNYRPEYRHGWGSKTYYSQLRLDTLPVESANALLNALLGPDASLKPLRGLLATKTEGNPLFLEESVRSLVETKALLGERGAYRMAQPVESVRVPATVQAILASRIDRLAPEEARLLQTAAVIGKDFPFALLQAIADENEEALHRGLSHLQAAEFLYETRLFPDLEYTFKHALTHEVAYGSLLAELRKNLHRRIGEAIQELYPDRLIEHYATLAYHYSKAEEWAKAFKYFLGAAEKAASAFSNREAVALYDQALEAAGHLGQGIDAKARMEIHQAKVNLCIVLSDFVLARAEGEKFLHLARETGNRVSESAALAQMAWLSGRAHELHQAIPYARQAVEIATEVDAKEILVAAHYTMGQTYAVTGRLDHAIEEIEKAHAVSRPGGGIAGQWVSIWLLGSIKNWQGHYGEADRLLFQALRLAQEYHLPFQVLFIYFVYAITLTGKGDYDQALSLFQEGLAFSEKVGDELVRLRLLNGLGWLYSELGDMERAIDLNRQSADGGHKRGDTEILANAELNLGEIFLARGDLVLAQEFLDGIHHLVKDPTTSEWMRWRYTTRLFAGLGELSLARGDPAKAREFADQCLDLATRSGSQKYLVRGWRLRGEIALALRQCEEAESLLQNSLRIAQAINNPTQLWKSHLAWGRLHAETNRQNIARQAYRAAHEILDGIRGSLRDPTLRASLENWPLIRHVYDLSAPS